MHETDFGARRNGLASIFGIDDILIATAGSSILGAITGSSAADKAAKTSAQANAAALQFQKDQAAQVQKNEQPFIDAGSQGLGYVTKTYANPQGTRINGNAYLQQNPDVAAEYQRQVAAGQFSGTPQGLRPRPLRPARPGRGPSGHAADRGQWAHAIG